MLLQRCAHFSCALGLYSHSTCSRSGPGAKPEGSASGALQSAWWDLCCGSEGRLCILWAEAPASSFCVTSSCFNMGLHEFSCSPHWRCQASRIHQALLDWLKYCTAQAQLAGCHSAPNVRGVAGCCSSILDEEPSSKAGVLLHCSGWWEPPLCACKWSRPGLPSLPLHSELLAGGFGGASLWEGTMRAGHGAVRAQMCSASSYHVFRE